MSKLHNGQFAGCDIGKTPYGGVKAEVRIWLFIISLGFVEHARQCDQRWLFRIRLSGKFGHRWRHMILGYRTRGDANPVVHAAFQDAGWWFPWQINRTCAGAY